MQISFSQTVESNSLTTNGYPHHQIFETKLYSQHIVGKEDPNAVSSAIFLQGAEKKQLDTTSRRDKIVFVGNSRSQWKVYNPKHYGIEVLTQSVKHYSIKVLNPKH